MKKIALFVAALAMVSLSACSSSSTTEANTEAENTETAVEIAPVSEEVTTGVVALDDDSKFTPATQVSVPTVLDFNAVWCVPCKKLTPAFDAAAEKFAGKVNFYSVDIDKCKETANAFGIESIPTVVILVPGGEPQSFVGLAPFGVTPDTPAASVTEVITNSMNEKIEAAVK